MYIMYVEVILRMFSAIFDYDLFSLRMKRYKPGKQYEYIMTRYRSSCAWTTEEVGDIIYIFKMAASRLSQHIAPVKLRNYVGFA